MRINIIKLTALYALTALAVASLRADVPKDGTHQHQDGIIEIVAPNGGRIVDTVEPHFEVFIEEDRSVRITFLDEDWSPIPPAGQEVSLIGGSRSDPTQLSFSREGNSLVSSGNLPEGRAIPIILSVRESPSAETVREKFNLNMAPCPECELHEYACVCGHGEGEHD